jgi:hypothetical protein
MLTLLIEKELKAILLSPKFSVTFGIASALIVLSAFLGIEEYQHTQRQFETAHQRGNAKSDKLDGGVYPRLPRAKPHDDFRVGRSK